MSRVLLLAALLPSTALAWDYESEPADLEFSDKVDVFEGAEYDTGWLPSGSPLAVRFHIDSKGGASTGLEATSRMGWPTPLSQVIEGVPGSGLFELATKLSASADLQIDLWGYRGAFYLWKDSLELEDAAEFDPTLLGRSVQAVSEGEGIDTVELTFGLFTGVDLEFTLDIFPRAWARTTGVQIDTNGVLATSEGQEIAIPVPDRNPGFVRMTSTYAADLEASLDLVLVPAMSVSAFGLGSFEVLSFDIPVPLVSYDQLRTFRSVSYEHPLPSLLPPATTYDFGTVEVGSLDNLELPLENVGRMDLEGVAHVEGSSSFTVFPTYFAASSGNVDGVVVTFEPAAAGVVTGMLVLETNDPVNPRLEIPLVGNGFVENAPDPGDPDEDLEPGSGSVRTCGCAAQPASGLGWLALAPLLLLRRRR